jgi:hypothetical protein
MSLLVPLTTTFTPAYSCLASNNIWQIIISTSFGYFLQGPPSTSDCLPSGYSYGDSGSGLTFYFPGICPLGYTAACTSTNSLGPYIANVQICCPSRFVFPLRLVVRNFVYPNSFQCQFSPSLEWQTTLGCFIPFTATEAIAVTVSQTGTTSTTSTELSGTVNAYAIAIATQNIVTQNIVTLNIATQNPGSSNQVSPPQDALITKY